MAESFEDLGSYDPDAADAPASSWLGRLPYWLKAAAAGIAGYVVVTLLSLLFRGALPSWGETAYMLALSGSISAFHARHYRHSPSKIVRSLRRLFERSAEPDLVDITSVLAQAGDASDFEPLRRVVDRLQRGMIRESEFYGAMRGLLFERTDRRFSP